MYRANLEKEKMTLTESGSQEQFLQRVVSLPVVTTALEQMTSLYNHTKDSNRLLKYAFQASETSVRVAANTAKPVVSKFEKPIEILNNFACTQLDKLEETYPIITEPTDKVYNVTLKPTVDRIISITDTGNHKIQEVQGFTSGKIEGVKHVTFKTADGVKHYTVETVNGMRQRGVNKLHGVRDYGSLKLNEVLNSPYGQVMTSKVNDVIDMTDHYVDYYLPQIDEEEEEQVDGKDPSPLGRVSTVGTKVGRRLSRRLSSELKNLETRSQSSLDKLNFTVNLIDYAKNNIGNVQNHVSAAGSKVKFWWDEITREEDSEATQDGERKIETVPTLERRILATARHATLTLKRGLETLSSKLPVLPSPLRTRLDQAKSYSEELYSNFSQIKTFEDLPQRIVDQVKVQVSRLQETLSHVTCYMTSTYSSIMSRLWGPKSDMIPEPIEMEEFAEEKVPHEIREEDGQKEEEEETSVLASEIIPPPKHDQVNNEADFSPVQ